MLMGEQNVLKSMELMVVQYCEYTNNDSYTLNVRMYSM